MKRYPRKIIYFDETSAVDLLQVRRKGKLTRTIESIKEFSGNLGGDTDVEANLEQDGGAMRILHRISGVAGGISASLGVRGSVGGNRIAKTVIENSLLYDFLEAAESRRGKPLLEIEEGYLLNIPKDSMTYYATIAPLTEMMEGHQKLDNPDITMAVSKMNTGIRNSKGYYELIGEKESNKKVFRFNIDTFKNNYRIQDLPKMNLVLYAIKVGKTSLSKLDFETEFNLDSMNSEINFTGLNEESKQHEIKKDSLIEVYDVFLAGVR
ncbi:DUF6414 family protein [Liquorilactobacillus satsumensis]|uniref:DUF6414 family protein n=1 Tax=Liquorilactobacillus satsumensis TaxID=259059 RepID=UPI0039EB8ED5